MEVNNNIAQKKNLWITNTNNVSEHYLADRCDAVCQVLSSALHRRRVCSNLKATLQNKMGIDTSIKHVGKVWLKEMDRFAWSHTSKW